MKTITKALRILWDFFVGLCIGILSVLAAALVFIVAGKIDTKNRKDLSKIVDDVLGE